MAMFFGTISPSTTCRKTTIVIAITNATGCSHSSGTCSAWNPGSIRCASAGSPTAPRPSEQTVMPSWAPAIIKETCSIAFSVVRAIRDPA
jgi:hypothetical protein